MNRKEVVKRLTILIEQVQHIKAMVEEMPSAIPDGAVQRAEGGLCVYCGEVLDDGGRKFRGAHERCYKRVNRAINSGVITEQQAVARGYILPVEEKGGRKPDSNDPIVLALKAEQSQTAKKKINLKGPGKRKQ